MYSTLPPFVSGIIANVEYVWGLSWWIIIPFLSFYVFLDAWLEYRRGQFVKSIKWQLLEIKVPKDILKTPKAMEQIFAAAQATYSGIGFWDKYFKGKLQNWMSFELVSIGGSVHFYLRLPAQFRNLMESSIYAQYPEAEIIEQASDYLDNLPKVLPNNVYDIFGSDLVFASDNCYPIRTYISFEENVEERRLDPISSIIEVLSRLKGEQQIWLQFLIRPAESNWKKEGEKVVNKLTGKKEDVKPTFINKFFEFLRDLALAPIQVPAGAAPKSEKSANLMASLTSGQKDVVENIEKKLAKIGFETTIRFIYIDRVDTFSRDNVAAFNGAFRQFNTLNLNSFKPDKETITGISSGLFKKVRLLDRKKTIYKKYRSLSMGGPKHFIILNTEELATIYHFPILGGKVPMIQRLEYKKGEPPQTLPVE
jgi:hypothetical protein